jgi:hypothetical protein
LVRWCLIEQVGRQLRRIRAARESPGVLLANAFRASSVPQPSPRRGVVECWKPLHAVRAASSFTGLDLFLSHQL